MAEKYSELSTNYTEGKSVELVLRALRKYEQLDQVNRYQQLICCHALPTCSYNPTEHAPSSPSVVPVSPYVHLLPGTRANPPTPMDAEFTSSWPSPQQSPPLSESTSPPTRPLSPLEPLLMPSSDEVFSSAKLPFATIRTPPPSRCFSPSSRPPRLPSETYISSTSSSSTLLPLFESSPTSSATLSQEIVPPAGVPPPSPPEPTRVSPALSSPEVSPQNRKKSIPIPETPSKLFKLDDSADPLNSDTDHLQESVAAGQVTPQPVPVEEASATPTHAEMNCDQFEMMSLQCDEVHLSWLCCKFQLTGFMHSICAWNYDAAAERQFDFRRNRRRLYLNKLLEDWYSPGSLKDRPLNVLTADINCRIENFVALLLQYTPVGHEELILKCIELLEATRIEFVELLYMRRAILETFPADVKSILWISKCTLEIIKGLRDFEFTLNNLYLGRVIWPDEPDATVK